MRKLRHRKFKFWKTTELVSDRVRTQTYVVSLPRGFSNFYSEKNSDYKNSKEKSHIAFTQMITLNHIYIIILYFSSLKPLRLGCRLWYPFICKCQCDFIKAKIILLQNHSTIIKSGNWRLFNLEHFFCPCLSCPDILEQYKPKLFCVCPSIWVCLIFFRNSNQFNIW